MLDFRIDTAKNLLAFSGGIDSTALFFLLLNENIPFDIAIVDYNVREQSKEEITYAKQLAKQYNKQCFVKEVSLQDTSNFEKQARDIRYAFFEELILTYKYESLLTAHQLDDCLEWFFMQFSKGAGLTELLGLKPYEKKENYLLLRPLLNKSKEELLNYLKNNEIKYFIDESNANTKYTRNRFRKEFTSTFLKEFKEGIQHSFTYLQKDLDSLNINYTPIYQNQEFNVYKASFDYNINLRIIDRDLKNRGIVLSKAQRDEIIKQKELVIAHKIAISLTKENIFIAPYRKVIMDKSFKEICRINKIPKNIRAYLFNIKMDLEELRIC